MPKVTITAKATVKDEDGKPVVDPETNKAKTIEGSASYDFGEDLDGLVAVCRGDKEVVKSNAIANMTVGIQALIRTAILAGISPEGLQIKVDSYVPGIAASKTIVDPLEAAAKAFDTWTPEQQQAYLTELGQRVAGAE